MKILLLMRHAKSSWDDQDLDDHDRPLNKRGKRDAPRMGALLKQAKIAPDLIVSSTAKRARKTAAKVKKTSECKSETVLEPELYLAGPPQMLRAIQSLPDEAETAMLVGHNPGIEYLLGQLTGVFQPMPTACVARIALRDIESWSEIGPDAKGELTDIWRPKEIFS